MLISFIIIFILLLCLFPYLKESYKFEDKTTFVELIIFIVCFSVVCLVIPFMNN